MLKYEEYLNHSAGNTLPMEEAVEIYAQMLDSYDRCTEPDKEQYYNDMLKAAFAYAAVRADWELYDNEEKMNRDKGRTAKHDGFIMAITILSRLMKAGGADIAWFERLGENRKRLGDFACFLTYMAGISNR